MRRLEVCMLHFLGGDSGQPHSVLAECMSRAVHSRKKWVAVFLALFLEQNFREAEEEGGEEVVRENEKASHLPKGKNFSM